MPHTIMSKLTTSVISKYAVGVDLGHGDVAVMKNGKVEIIFNADERTIGSPVKNEKVVLEQVVLEKVQQINNDFIVIMTHCDDYDRYGAKIEVECANGWSGWSWELKHEIKAKKKELYDSIIKESVINDKGEKITDINDMVHGLIFGNTLP